jgi:hypothetical protein
LKSRPAIESLIENQSFGENTILKQLFLQTPSSKMDDNTPFIPAGSSSQYGGEELVPIF